MLNRINNRFNSLNNDGVITAFKWQDISQCDKIKKLYILNKYESKLLQLIFSTEKKYYAQIKIIPYGVSGIIIDDEEELNYEITEFKNIEFTYHGSSSENESPKIHLKYLDKKNGNHQYNTLIDTSNLLYKDTYSVIPLFSLLIGKNSRNKKKTPLKKSVKRFKVYERYPQIIDFYFASKNLNMDQFLDSIYSFQMKFFSLDYLSKKKRHPLNNALISQPIEVLNLDEFKLFVRCSRSRYVGSPILKFYNNSDYYDKFMNRDMMYLNNDKTLTSSINMREEAFRKGLDFK